MLEATFPKTINFILHLHPIAPGQGGPESNHQCPSTFASTRATPCPHGGTITIVTGVSSGDELRVSFGR
jgi:hypothetical protein